MTLVCVPYSQADVDAATQKISVESRNGRLPAWSMIEGNDSFDGIIVSFKPGDLAGRDLAALTKQLTSVAGLPVSITEGGVTPA